jgi:hypothetical protein
MDKKGQSMGGRIMAVIFGTILLVGAAIPITQSTIDSSNLSGTTATVVGFIPLFLGLAGLALSAALVQG